MQAVLTRLDLNHNNRDYEMVTIVNGNVVYQQPRQRRIFIAANTQQVTLQHQPGGAGTPWTAVGGVAPVTLAQVTAFVNIIVNDSFNNNYHRRVIHNAGWRAIYSVAPRALLYLAHGAAPCPKPPADTVACHDCGLVLPLANIDIDHQRPKVGNDYEPVCKVFRAMGLTQAGPSGPKGGAVLATYAPSVGAVAPPASARNAAGAALYQKYTLTDRGQIFYSLVHWAGQSMILQERCLNHVINLRPLCGACNTPNRNTRHF